MDNTVNHDHSAVGRRWLAGIAEGALIGTGAVLPGISGGVLCVVFGIYQPVMELLANPFNPAVWKKNLPMLAPILLGGAIGFLGVSKILAFLLNRYPDASVCVFIGLIAGMIPGLFKQANEKGRTKGDWISFGIAFIAVMAILIGMQTFSIHMQPGFFSWLVCGFFADLSVIVPGMSFSTFLMPLSLYTPFIDGIGQLNFSVILPAALSAVITVLVLSKAVNFIFDHYYSLAFYGIIGITIAATLMIVPFSGMASSAGTLITDLVCLMAGAVFGYLLDQWNQKHEAKDE